MSSDDATMQDATGDPGSDIDPLFLAASSPSRPPPQGTPMSGITARRALGFNTPRGAPSNGQYASQYCYIALITIRSA